MSTTAISGLLAIVVCAMLQGNPLQLQLQSGDGQTCLLRAGAVLACVDSAIVPALVERRSRRG